MKLDDAGLEPFLHFAYEVVAVDVTTGNVFEVIGTWSFARIISQARTASSMPMVLSPMGIKHTRTAVEPEMSCMSRNTPVSPQW